MKRLVGVLREDSEHYKMALTNQQRIYERRESTLQWKLNSLFQEFVQRMDEHSHAVSSRCTVATLVQLACHFPNHFLQECLISCSFGACIFCVAIPDCIALMAVSLLLGQGCHFGPCCLDNWGVNILFGGASKLSCMWKLPAGKSFCSVALSLVSLCLPHPAVLKPEYSTFRGRSSFRGWMTWRDICALGV